MTACKKGPPLSPSDQQRKDNGVEGRNVFLARDVILFLSDRDDDHFWLPILDTSGRDSGQSSHYPPTLIRNGSHIATLVPDGWFEK